ncbi:MAG TPA: DUF899 family protein [Pseudonocardiaceae bacterium]|nr:DUF899 family protein [Pseudonocardiaceae bacterium]
MNTPPVVSAEDWQAARDELLVAEKELTHAQDALAARRRRLSMVKFRNDYTFDTPTGPRTLLDLFEGQPQLAVYQFMDNGPDEYCPGCTFFTDNIPEFAQRELADRGVSWATISNMPLAQIEAYQKARGWTVPFISSRNTTFAADCGADYFMLSLFLRGGDDVYRTYNTTSRGVDGLLFIHGILDLAPYGRQQDWEDSPAGWPQHPTYG